MTKNFTNKLQKLSEIIKNYPDLAIYHNEANTKKRLIEPLLEILGWDLRSNEAFLEYPLSTGTSTVHVDYALLIENKPILFFEAKAYSEPLLDKYSKQIITYGRIEGVKWVALSNGKEMQVFNTEKGKSKDECLVLEIDLKIAAENNESLSLFTRESILSGEIENVVKRMSVMKTALKNIKLKQNKLKNDFKECLVQYTGNEIENYVSRISEHLITETIQLFENPFEEQQKSTTSEIKIINRNALLDSHTPGEVIICPSKPDGVDFLEKYNAWGYVNVSKSRNPEYFALYIGAPKSAIIYFGEIDSISEPLTSKSEIPGISEEDIDKALFDKGKRIIFLKPNSLVKLENPVPLGNNVILQSIRYISLNDLVKAKTVDDIK